VIIKRIGSSLTFLARHRFATTFVCLVGWAMPAAAGQMDPVGDILPTYVNQATAKGDLDVIFIDFTYDPVKDVFFFTSTLADNVGLTPGAFYVWGVDRGKGTERFVGGSPSIGAGVKFDAVVVLRPDTSVTVTDIINAKSTNLGLGKASINGATISASIAGSLLPTFGAGFPEKGHYTANLWPRVGAGNNNQVTDFAPNASNLLVTVVPEPTSIALIALAIPVLGFATRHRVRSINHRSE
jgi:PEP-CTERM motif